MALVTLFDATPERAPVRRVSLVRLSAEIVRVMAFCGATAIDELTRDLLGEEDDDHAKDR